MSNADLKEFVITAIRYKKGIRIEAEHHIWTKNKRKAKKAFKEDHPKFEILGVRERKSGSETPDI